MDAARRQLLLVLGRALLLMPLTFAAWYTAAGPLSWIPGRIAAPVIGAIAGGPASMGLQERALVYTVTLEQPYRPGGASRVAAEIEVLAAKFTYGIALFLALAVAAKESRQPLGIAVGCAALVALPAFGIAFEALKTLGTTPSLEPFLRWGAGTREAIALGYQVGTLLLPTLGPIAIWLALARGLWAPPPLPAAPGRLPRA
jgi:hypothetical protein